MRYAFVLFIVTGSATTLTYGEESQSPSARIDGYHEFNYGRVNDGVEQWAQAVRVSEPELRSGIRGDVTVRFQAPGMTQACALCWRQSPDRLRFPRRRAESIPTGPTSTGSAGSMGCS